MKFLSATSNLRVEQNLVDLERFLDVRLKVVGLTLKTEIFIRNFEFTCRSKFSGFW